MLEPSKVLQSIFPQGTVYVSGGERGGKQGFTWGNIQNSFQATDRLRLKYCSSHHFGICDAIELCRTAATDKGKRM